MGSNGIRELSVIFNLIEGDQNLRRYLLVEFDILFELLYGRRRQRLHIPVCLVFFQQLRFGLEKVLILRVSQNSGPLTSLDKHLYGPVRQLQQLKDGADRTDRVNVFGHGVILDSILLCHQKDLLVALKRTHRLFPSDEQRDNHMGKDNNIPKGQNRKRCRTRRTRHLNSFITAKAPATCRASHRFVTWFNCARIQAMDGVRPVPRSP